MLAIIWVNTENNPKVSGQTDKYIYHRALAPVLKSALQIPSLTANRPNTALC